MHSRDHTVYGPAFAELLSEPRVMPLGPGEPNTAVYQRLKTLTPEAALKGHTIRDMDMARAALAGVWLYHDFLDESHTTSQSIDTPTGSYWHGIMHRREPDYANAKYWFRRVGDHPVFASFQREAAEIGAGAKWDPFRFIDVCEKAANGGPMEDACREIQMTEWWELFDHCYCGAIGEPEPSVTGHL